MSPTHCLRLLVLCLWLLDGDVNCENTQKGYVLQAGQAPMRVHNDDGNYKRWREPSIYRIPKAGYRTPSVDRGQSGDVYPAQEEHSTDSKSPQIQSSYRVVPETRNNFPKSHVNNYKPGFNSASRTRSNVVYSRSGSKAFTFPDGNKANSDSVLSTGVLQVPPRIYGARTGLTGGLSFNRDRANLLLQTVLKPTDKKADSAVMGRSPGSNSGGKAVTQMSYPTWRPRAYSSEVTPEARGYAHVRRLKPQAHSAADRKISETGFPSVKQNQGSYSRDSTQPGFGLGVAASSDRWLNLDSSSRGSQPGSRHPPSPNGAQVPVQGKFKPFQRLPTNPDLPAHTLASDNETAPAQTSAGTTLPPGLNSTGITSSVVPSVNGEPSTESASPTQTEGRHTELVPQASDHEGQSEGSAGVGPSSEQNGTFTVSPPKTQPAEKEGNGDGVVLSHLETDQSDV